MDSEYKRLMSPSISLLVLAAMTPARHTVYIEDENAGKINFADNPDLVGINVNVDTSSRAYHIAARYRERGVPVVLGGIHASADPAEALHHADAVCIGQAENLWREILQDAEDRCLKRTYSSDKAADPTKTPAPRWDLLDRSKYLYTNVICASRGCPFKCEFCYNSCDYMHKGFQNRPIKNILDEVAALGTRHVMFIDDNFIGNVDWTRKFVRAIKPLNLTWHAAVSTNIGQHLDLLDEMSESGCKSLFIGFESVNKNSIFSVHKYQNHTDKYEQIIREIHVRNIMVNASMVFGFDHDYPEVFDDTLNWLIKNKIETMTAHILTPYPGTRLYERLCAERRVYDHNRTHYNTSHVVFVPKNMTREQLLNGYLWIYRKFYSFGSILKRMPEYPQIRLPYLLFNLCYRKFGWVTSKVARLGLMNIAGRLARRLAYGIE